MIPNREFVFREDLFLYSCLLGGAVDGGAAVARDAGASVIPEAGVLGAGRACTSI